MTTKGGFRRTLQPTRARARRWLRGGYPSLPFLTGVSANGRYFLDQFSNPYWMQGSSPQAMASKINASDMQTYMSDQQTRGINFLQIHLMTNERFPGSHTGSTNVNGDAPFSNMTNFTTPVTAYWNLVDTMFSLAVQYGMSVMASPCENISYGPTLASMTDTECVNFGAFIGGRYKNQPGLMWSFGNDWQGSEWFANQGKNAKVLEGIRNAGDTHLCTVWLNYTDSISTDLVDVGGYTAWDARIDAQLAYSYTLPYWQIEQAYTRTSSEDPRPVFGGEYNYENEHLHPEFGEGTTTALTIRRSNWWTVTWGACGNHFTTNPIEFFDTGWQSNLNTTMMQQYKLVKDLMTTFSNWHLLVPDVSHAFQTGGRGTHNTAENTDPLDNDFATCARTPDGTLSVTYFPSSRGSITYDMSLMGSGVTATWYDASDLSTVSESTPSAPTHPGANTAGDSDWVLVMQAATPLPFADAHVARRKLWNVIPHMARRSRV